MHKQFERIVVVSVRTTCWEKGMRPEDEEHEIIEVGTCILDVATLEISQKQSVCSRSFILADSGALLTHE